MDLSLENKEWKEFFFHDIFRIYSTSSGIDKNKLLLRSGTIPYITRSENNNGIDLFLSSQNEKYCIDKSNVITIGLDTQTVFFQKHYFYTGQNIQILENKVLAKFNSLFLISLIKIQLEKFNWGGNGATLSRLMRSKILLPINSDEEPDYEFMENYIRGKEQEKINKYIKIIEKRIKELDVIEPVVALSEKEWGEFEIGKLFKLMPGKSKGLNHLTKIKNGVNYLGATNSNNGVLCQVESVKNIVQKGNCIAFIRNGEGSMGYSVYKSEDFIATSDISIGYNDHLNRYNGIFITTIADRIRGKYNFGYKRSEARLKKEKLTLPVNQKKEPDFEYMENYMKRLEYEKLKKYLNFKKDEHET